MSKFSFIITAALVASTCFPALASDVKSSRLTVASQASSPTKIKHTALSSTQKPHRAVRVKDIQTGYLEIVWGDPSDTTKPSHLSVSLVNGKERISLDPEQAQKAAEDLFALAGQKVAIYTNYTNSSTGEIEAMIEADPSAALPGKASSAPFNSAFMGQHQWKTIACKFSSWPLLPVSVGFLSQQYGRMRGHIGHYWHEMSYGKLNVQGRAHGWFDLNKPRRAYVVNGVVDTKQLGEDCIQAALPYVDFSQTHGINIALNEDLNGYAYGGKLCADFPGSRQQCTPMTWLPPSGYLSLRIMMHEMGHAYTLPHSDNSDGDADTYDNVWDLMSSTSWAPQHPILGGRPQYLTTWHRKRLGWIPDSRVATYMEPRANNLVYLDSVSRRGGKGKHVVILRQAPARDREGNIPDPHNGVHYTIEARTNDVNFDRSLPGEAVIIHRVQHGLFSKPMAMDADVPPANRNSNEGSMFKVRESWTTPEGFGTVRVIARTPEGFLISVGPAR